MLLPEWTTMAQFDDYQDLKGQIHSLVHLDANERELLRQLQHRAAGTITWNEFSTYWMAAVRDFYEARGLNRQGFNERLPFVSGKIWTAGSASPAAWSAAQTIATSWSN
jgi:hypothetical protein